MSRRDLHAVEFLALQRQGGLHHSPHIDRFLGAPDPRKGLLRLHDFAQILNVAADGVDFLLQSLGVLIQSARPRLQVFRQALAARIIGQEFRRGARCASSMAATFSTRSNLRCLESRLHSRVRRRRDC